MDSSRLSWYQWGRYPLLLSQLTRFNNATRSRSQYTFNDLSYLRVVYEKEIYQGTAPSL